MWLSILLILSSSYDIKCDLILRHYAYLDRSNMQFSFCKSSVNNEQTNCNSAIDNSYSLISQKDAMFEKLLETASASSKLFFVEKFAFATSDKSGPGCSDIQPSEFIDNRYILFLTSPSDESYKSPSKGKLLFSALSKFRRCAVFYNLLVFPSTCANTTYSSNFCVVPISSTGTLTHVVLA